MVEDLHRRGGINLDQSESNCLDLEDGTRLDKLPTEFLKKIITNNLEHARSHNTYNMDPNLLAALDEYVKLRERSKESLRDKIELFKFNRTNYFKPTFPLFRFPKP